LTSSDIREILILADIEVIRRPRKSLGHIVHLVIGAYSLCRIVKLEIVVFDDLEVDEMDVHRMSEGEDVYHEPVLGRTDHWVLTFALVEVHTATDRVCAAHIHHRSEAFHCYL
jgi:hypothetical protein